MNIPIYRGLKLGSDEYVEGYYLKLRFNSWFKHYLLTEHSERIEIDPTTLCYLKNKSKKTLL